MGFPSHGGRNINIGVGVEGKESLGQSIRDVDFILSRLQGIKRGIKDLNIIWPDVFGIIKDGIDETFETAGHGNWKELRPDTIELREERGTGDGARFPGQPILNEYGDMYDSIDVYRSTNQELVIKATDPKASTHEYGDPTSRIPARPFMYMDGKTLSSLGKYLSNYLYNIIQESDPKNRARRERTWGYRE